MEKRPLLAGLMASCALSSLLAGCVASTTEPGAGTGSSESGLTATLAVSELTPEQVLQFCRWAAEEVFPEERTAICGGIETTFNLTSPEQCVQQYERVAADCESSVEEVEACLLAGQADLCLLTPESDAEVCAGYHACNDRGRMQGPQATATPMQSR